MTLPAALLLSLLSTDVSRSRSVEVPGSLERTVARLAAGVACSLGSERLLAGVCEAIEGEGATRIHHPRLYVDGRGTGWPVCRVARAVWRLGLFVSDLGPQPGSVELRYEATYRGLWLHRSVYVADGVLVSRVWVDCKLGPAGRLRRFDCAAVARERPRHTSIALTASVRVNTGLRPGRSRSRCRLVNRVAAGAVRRQLDATLSQLERDGRRMAAAGQDALLDAARRFTDCVLLWNEELDT